MKLTNVHYEYRGNDTWRIYFKDYQEADAFRNITIEDKPQIAKLLPIFTNGKGVRYCVEAKLTGQFNILRHYVRDGADKYSSSHPWAKLVKKIEGADSDYIFDEIDLWYDATVDKCYFKICCMNGTWTDPFVKIMLNSQFGMAAQANGYYDTDTVGQGGFCVRRSCCGIGIGYHHDHGNTEERIRFTVKNFCRGEADVIKVSPWTNTFIGTNKENEKEYSWANFKQYMQKLSANGSDIWDIEWKYDETCPMTGTEVADKLYLYLKPLAYKRLFEEKEKEANNKEDNNMKIYWDESQPRIENVRDIVLASYRYDRTVYYYRVYFESVVDAKNVMECGYNQDKGRHCWYYMMIASTAELSEEMKGSIKTLYLTYNKNETRYYINWKAMYETPLKANAHFEMKMTAQLNDEQLKVWEAALGIGNQPKHKKEKTVGDVVNEFTEDQKKVLYYLIAEAQKSGKAENTNPTKILIQSTATIIWWSDGTKTIVKCQKGDKMDPEKGIAMCVMKKFMGTNETHSNYLDFAKPAIEEYEKQQAAEKAKKKAEADKRRRAAAKKKGAAGKEES